MSGFALDRAAADTALRYEPVGAFLVRMCSEPGLFAISCRTSQDVEGMRTDAAAHGFASAGTLTPGCRYHAAAALVLLHEFGALAWLLPRPSLPEFAFSAVPLFRYLLSLVPLHAPGALECMFS